MGVKGPTAEGLSIPIKIMSIWLEAVTVIELTSIRLLLLVRILQFVDRLDWQVTPLPMEKKVELK